MALTRERVVLLAVLALAALSCLLGLLARPPLEGASASEQLLDLVRVVSTACLAIAALFGPGILWRLFSGRRQGLAFVPLPGLLLLAVTGVLAWVLGGEVEPRVVCFAVLGPVIGLLFGALLGGGEEDLFEPEEQRALVLVGCVLGFAIGRTLWSLGPEGELYAGTISRTLQVGDRSDSRIPFLIPQLIQHHHGPYSQIATEYFFPYNFSSRGPTPGLASSPIVFLSGGRPPQGYAEEPWKPFDPAGFMAFRLAMMTFACTAFLSLWDLVRRLGGLRAARFALLLAATTPFLLDEVWFTWPKLLGASLVLMGAIFIVERKAFRSGVMVGLGYLMHPGAILAMAAMSLIALWPLRGANWRRPDLKALALLVAGVAISVLAWRLANGSHYSQNEFAEYLTSNGTEADPSFTYWLGYRITSLGNTLVPMLLPFANTHDHTLNVVEGTSPFAVHFFFQYWNTFPFGIGILFFPFAFVGLWKAYRLWRWPVLAAIVIPFLAFAVYWGGSRTGMLREGLHWWVLIVLATIALQQAAAGFPWLRSTPLRAILSLRAAELVLIAIGPALTTGEGLISSTFELSDVVALVAMGGFAVLLGGAVWHEGPRRAPS